jgi:hypothetical protein
VSRAVLNLAIAAGAVTCFLVMVRATGLIPVSDGVGYDGGEYADLVVEGLDEGTPNTRLRPLVVLLARPAYLWTDDVVQSFRILNVFFAGALSLLTCLLADAYGIRPLLKVYLVGSLAACIATARMPAFYPVLVDLGAYVFLLAAVWAVVVERRLLASALAVLAAASREFGIMAVAFGVHRGLRRGDPPHRVAATYGPALVVMLVIRILAGSAPDGDGRSHSRTCGQTSPSGRIRCMWRLTSISP